MTHIITNVYEIVEDLKPAELLDNKYGRKYVIRFCIVDGRYIHYIINCVKTFISFIGHFNFIFIEYAGTKSK